MASGLVRTYWKNNDGVGAITDSAPGGTTFATGHKTNDKFVGVTPDSIPVASIVEAANQLGKATGIVATSNIQHATPAAFSSHYNSRSKYDIIAPIKKAKLTGEGIEAKLNAQRTNIAKVMKDYWGISLDETTKKLYVEAETAFKAKGATVTVDTQVRATALSNHKKPAIISRSFKEEFYETRHRHAQPG